MKSTGDALALEANNADLAREKLSHIIKAARSATAANILAPLLCIPMFGDEVRRSSLYAWLAYMFVAVFFRTWVVHKIHQDLAQQVQPQRGLQNIALAVGVAGLGWGLGWPLMTPDLNMVNRMIYVYMTTAAMISGMFAYSVDRRTFYAFTLPIMVPAVSTILWPVNIFPWPFLVGLVALYGVVLGIARSFSKIFTESVQLRFGNDKLYQALADERDQSIAANVAKSKFIAAASHDLRQPLHAVNINLELFQLSELRDKDANLVRRIKGSVMALNNMFEALLNVSKLDSRAAAVSNSDFLLSELVEEMREMLELRATAKGVALLMQAPQLVVRGDKLLLQQLLINLVMNAIQYTEKGSVQVLFTSERERLVVAVIDSGVGISSEDQKNIFNEFYRAELTRNTHEGLGLGLSIVRRISKLINASVSVESTLGQGSVFRVVTDCLAMRIGDAARLREIDTHATWHEAGDLKGKVIAILEDDGVIADAYTQTLLAHGASVVVLSEVDSELLVQLASINHIDCILSDYRLRDATGIEVIEKIRENYNEDIPAVMVTGDTSPRNIDAFSDLDAIVLYKPLTLGRIIESISEAIQSRRH
mgnify:FL=1